MEKCFYALLLMISGLFISSDSIGQVSGSDAKPEDDYKYDAKLLLHYSIDELNDLRVNHPDDYNRIVYYHTSSYQLEITDSTNAYLSLFNISTFDVTLYEPLRSLNETVELDFDKYGVKVYILPFNELLYLTTLQEYRKNELEN